MRIERRQSGGGKNGLQTIAEIPLPFQTIDIVRLRSSLLKTGQRGKGLAVAEQLRQRGPRCEIRLLRHVGQ
ncbi:hypothetical protein D3C80_1548350 [compost metagenome]